MLHPPAAPAERDARVLPPMTSLLCNHSSPWAPPGPPTRPGIRGTFTARAITQEPVLLCDPVLRTISVALGLVFVAGGVARANPAGVVPTALYPGIGEQAHFEADYEYDIDSALITREQVGDPTANPDAPLGRHRDLEFH